MSMRAVKPNFLLLREKENQCFDYAGKVKKDFSTLKVGERSEIILYNTDLDRKERIRFECTHNQDFPLIGGRLIHGLIQKKDCYFQLEFLIKNSGTVTDAKVFWREKPIF